MQELILYIQPQLVNEAAQDFVRVDLMEAELITLTQVIQDVKEIDKIFTDYSRTFNLPASKTNNKIFKYWYNPDVIGFDNQIMASAIIELNHLPFKEGKIKLEEVVMKDGKPSIYKVTFFGNTVSLSNLIGEDQLENLNWLSNFNYLSSFANIKDGFENGIDITVDSVTYTDAIIYPLLTHTQQYIFNTVSDYDNFANIAYVSGYTDTQYYNKRGVFPEDLKPAIKATLIIKAIEEQYNVKFKTGEFFDSAAISNMYMWLHREKGSVNQDLNSQVIVDTTFSCAVGTISGAVVESDSCNFFATTTQAKFDNGKWEIEKTSDLDNFQTTHTVTPSSSTQQYTIKIIDELNGQVLGETTGVGVQSIFIKHDVPVGSQMSIGDKKNIVAQIVSDYQLTFTTEIKIFAAEFALTSIRKNYFSIYTHTTQITTINDTLSIISNIPKMSVLNFLKGLFKMHNLTAFVNDNNEIVVKTLDSFYSGGDTIDISKYVVTDKNTIGANLPFTEIDLQYPEPKTILAQQFLQQNNQRFGELEFISNASKGSKYVVEAPFEHMMFERLNDLSDGSQTGTQYGLFIDDDLKPAIGAPLLFYGTLKYTGSGQFINYVETTRPESGTPAAGTRYGISNYWMPSNYNEVGTSSTAPTYNTNFGSEINEYNLTDYGGANNSLFQLYYENYITRVFNKKTRLFKYKAILPLSILIKLSLDDKIVVGTREFTINKMTTKLQSGETELELLNEPT